MVIDFVALAMTNLVLALAGLAAFAASWGRREEPGRVLDTAWVRGSSGSPTR